MYHHQRYYHLLPPITSHLLRTPASARSHRPPLRLALLTGSRLKRRQPRAQTSPASDISSSIQEHKPHAHSPKAKPPFDPFGCPRRRPRQQPRPLTISTHSWALPPGFIPIGPLRLIPHFRPLCQPTLLPTIPSEVQVVHLRCCTLSRSHLDHPTLCPSTAALICDAP